MNKEPKSSPDLNLPEDENKTSRKNPSVALRYADIYDQSVTVLRQWSANEPTFTCPLVDYNTLQAESTLLGNYLQTSKLAQTGKKSNSQTLKEAKQAVIDAVKILRAYIKAEFPLQKDLSVIYQEYGLEKNARNTYNFPTDHGRLAMSLNILLAKMQERGNPFAAKPYGLAFWQDLRDTHLDAWQESEDIRSTRSNKVSNTKTQAAKVKKLLQDLHGYVKFIHKHGDYRAALRNFGFLKETF